MDVRRLNYFIVTAEERSISRAAERLHITQPPLTRHIQSLEEELGVSLFTRTAWGVDLTDAGKALLVHARDIKAHVELAADQIRHVAAGKAGRVDIGVFGSAMLNIVPKILASFAASRPEVSVALHIAPKSRQIDALQQGRILIAFDRYFPEYPLFQSELVCREPLWLAINRCHPLANADRVSVDDLRSEPLIGEQDQSVFFAGQALFRYHNFEPRIVHKAADMLSAVVLVAGGFGCALVPESMLSLQMPKVVYRPMTSEVDSLIDLHCLYRKGEQSSLLDGLLACVHAYSAEP